MGLLDNTTQSAYYQGNDHGNYQFTSLDDIINQFEVAYVGENKLIPKIKRADIAFYAQRALQELTFDTLKSCKSQEITLPPSLKMTLPHDYVNYTKVSWVDSAGIKHPLYYTHDTSNPFTIAQHEDGTYDFDGFTTNNLVLNGDFNPANPLANWIYSTDFDLSQSYLTYVETGLLVDNFIGGINATSKITFKHQAVTGNSSNPASLTGQVYGAVNHIWQEVDVSSQDFVDLSALGQAVDTTDGAAGILRVGLMTSLPASIGLSMLPNAVVPNMDDVSIFDLSNANGDPSYLEWTASTSATSASVSQIDVTGIDTVFVVVTSHHEHTASEYLLGLQETNNIDNVAVSYTFPGVADLSSPNGNEQDSVTWNRYKSNSFGENNNDDYEDDTYWPMRGERYGLDPQHAQVNGSFYIDCRLGKIHFSSNLSGRTIVLDYISDSVGTDKEMQVHKFAEKAMYKSIAHAILSASSYGRALVPRLTKEKFAAVRKAKIRLSNLKLGELTQILRGKSKWIKH